MSGFLRMLGVIAVVLLGGLAILVVLGVLPPELLQQWGVKVAAVIGILAVVAFLVALLSRQR
jgi:putative flippase GtrA